ncbi:MAG: phosphate-starvation-inducible PsiE family protein [Halothece sp.]
MRQWRRLRKQMQEMGKDENFLKLIQKVENFVSKVLSLALLCIILVALFDLIIYLVRDVSSDPLGFFNKTLIELFGLFLNILIALELLENITAYLRKHIVQVELVIVTSLIAVARKIIIFDLKTYSSSDLMALAFAILALSGSYWLLRQINDKDYHQ